MDQEQTDQESATFAFPNRSMPDDAVAEDRRCEHGEIRLALVPGLRSQPSFEACAIVPAADRYMR